MGWRSSSLRPEYRFPSVAVASPDDEGGDVPLSTAVHEFAVASDPWRRRRLGLRGRSIRPSIGGPFLGTSWSRPARPFGRGSRPVVPANSVTGGRGEQLEFVRAHLRPVSIPSLGLGNSDRRTGHPGRLIASRMARGGLVAHVDDPRTAAPATGRPSGATTRPLHLDPLDRLTFRRADPPARRPPATVSRPWRLGCCRGGDAPARADRRRPSVRARADASPAGLRPAILIRDHEHSPQEGVESGA